MEKLQSDWEVQSLRDWNAYDQTMASSLAYEIKNAGRANRFYDLTEEQFIALISYVCPKEFGQFTTLGEVADYVLYINDALNYYIEKAETAKGLANQLVKELE